MITEALMSIGSWQVDLSPTAPYSLWNDLELFGHIVILPQYLDPSVVGDAALLAAARYVGPLLKKEIANDRFTLTGGGMAWWLGDSDGKGAILEQEIDLSAGSTLDNALTQVLPTAITKGTVTEPGGSYEGVHQWETSLEAVRTICASLSAEFRVNNDGTIDAGPNTDIFTILTPKVVVTSQPGTDPILYSFATDSMSMMETGEPYVSRAIVVTTDSDNVKTIVGYSDRIPAPTQTDIHGNAFARTLQVEASGGPVSVATYLLSQLSDHAITAEINISTAFEEMANGTLNVGDAFYAYEPPAFVDTDNEVYYRGQVINPKIIRLLSASWPLRSGMSVFYRSPAVTPVYVDLSRHVQWESGATEGKISF